MILHKFSKLLAKLHAGIYYAVTSAGIAAKRRFKIV